MPTRVIRRADHAPPWTIPAEEFSTLARELGHEMLHHTDNGERPARTVRETEAEAVAFVVCQAIGLDTNTAASDYIQLYAGDKNTLAASLDHIQRTSARIISAILDDQQVDAPRWGRPAAPSPYRRPRDRGALAEPRVPTVLVGESQRILCGVPSVTVGGDGCIVRF